MASANGDEDAMMLDVLAEDTEDTNAIVLDNKRSGPISDNSTPSILTPITPIDNPESPILTDDASPPTGLRALPEAQSEDGSNQPTETGAPKVHYAPVSEDEGSALDSDASAESVDEDVQIARMIRGKPISEEEVNRIWKKGSELYKGIRDMGVLVGQSVKEMKDLLKDPALVKIWSEYNEGYLIPKRQAKSTTRSVSFNSVRETIVAGEASGMMKYTNPHITTAELATFSAVDWAARFISQCFEYYRTRRHGFLNGRNYLTDNQVYSWFFHLKKHLEWNATETRIRMKTSAKVRNDVMKEINEQVATGTLIAPSKPLHLQVQNKSSASQKGVQQKASGKVPLGSHIAATFTDIFEEGDDRVQDFDDLDTVDMAAKLVSTIGGTRVGQEDQYQLGDMKRELSSAIQTGVEMTKKNRYEYRLNVYNDIVGTCKEYTIAYDKFHHGRDALEVHSDAIMDLDDADQIERVNKYLNTDDKDVIPFNEQTTLDRETSDWLRNLLANPNYQPDDVKAALKAFRIRDWAEPRLGYMRKNIRLRWWQLTGAHALKEMRAAQLLRGMLFADKVGTGKTFSMCTVIASVSPYTRGSARSLLERSLVGFLS
jgi:hypothetical protein